MKGYIVIFRKDSSWDQWSCINMDVKKTLEEAEKLAETWRAWYAQYGWLTAEVKVMEIVEP